MLFCAKWCLDLLLGGCLLKNLIMHSFLMYGRMKLYSSLGLCGVMLYFKPLLSICVALGFRGVENKLTMCWLICACVWWNCSISQAYVVGEALAPSSC